MTGLLQVGAGIILHERANSSNSALLFIKAPDPIFKIGLLNCPLNPGYCFNFK
jgi:hypothetical protein